MSLVHHLHYYWIRFGNSVCGIAIDIIEVSVAIYIGWQLVPWVAPVIARLCPYLIC